MPSARERRRWKQLENLAKAPKVFTHQPTSPSIYLFTYLLLLTYLRTHIYILPSHPTYPHNYLPTHLHTHPPIYTPTYLHTHLPTHPPTYTPTYLHTHLPTHPPTYTPTYQHTHLPTHPATYTPTYLHTHLPAHPPTYLPTYPPIHTLNQAKYLTNPPIYTPNLLLSPPKHTHTVPTCLHFHP